MSPTPPVVKPIGKSSLTTIGFAISLAALAAGGAAWATSIDSQVKAISVSVDRIESQIDKLADFNTRIAVIEAAIVRLERHERGQP